MAQSQLDAPQNKDVIEFESVENSTGIYNNVFEREEYCYRLKKRTQIFQWKNMKDFIQKINDIRTFIVGKFDFFAQHYIKQNKIEEVKQYYSNFYEQRKMETFDEHIRTYMIENHSNSTQFSRDQLNSSLNRVFFRFLANPSQIHINLVKCGGYRVIQFILNGDPTKNYQHLRESILVGDRREQFIQNNYWKIIQTGEIHNDSRYV